MRVEVRGGSLLGCMALLVLATGCPLDDRKLHVVETGDSDDTSSGGSGKGGSNGAGLSASNDSGGAAATDGKDSAGGATNGGGSDSVATGPSDGMGGTGTSTEDTGSGGSGPSGESSSGGTGGSHIGICPDLDDNGVPDCDETLALNAAFDADIAHWEPEQTAKAGWVEGSASDSDDTGSIAVTNVVDSTIPDTLVLTGAYQCLTVREGRDYLIHAQTFVPGGAGQGVAGALSALFFDSNNCSGSIQLAVTSRLSPSQGSWRTLQIEATAPADANSVKVRLAAVKIGTEPPAEVHFDNVLVRQR